MAKLVVTTSWDDGHMLDMRMADLLARYGLQGTFYISPRDRELKPEERLSAEQVRALDARFEVGAHTMTHPRLTELAVPKAREEILGSKRYLEELLGKEVTSFCYPGGHFDRTHVALVRDAGFRLARTVRQRSLAPVSDPFAVATTVHAYPHRWHVWEPWDERAIRLFNNAQKQGGVYHLWGHSWEIDKHGDWDKLERVFQHMRGAEASYVPNAALV